MGDERTGSGNQSVSAEAAGGETMHVCPAVLYVDSIGEIAERLGRSENYISVSLNRIRGKLHTHLTERGFEL